MNKNYRILNSVLCCGLAAGMLCACGAKEEARDVANTIEVLPGDSPEVIIEKATRVVPTDNQLSALENEFIAFIHFGPNTFTRKEWGNGMEDPKVFDLENLDTDQWCEAMKAAGMKMVILTVKHHDGFVLWQSRYTDHGIMSTGFRDGKGDILKDLSESCRKYGLKLGIYLSPADLYQIESPDGLYGNGSQYTKRTIPRQVEGRPFENKTTFEFEVDDYNEYFLNQLFELLTEYGPVHELWFDGAHPKQKGGQKYNYQAWRELIHALAPEAVIFGKEDLRWCGNEAGGTRDTEFNVVPYQFDPDTANYFPDMTDIDLASRDKLASAAYLHYQPAETNTSIREGWFYRDDDKQKVRSADDVFDIYERSVGGNSIFLLNIPPNREGRFSDTDANVLKEVGKRISETYGTNLMEGAKGAKKALDGSLDTYQAVGDGIEIKMPAPVAINRIVLQEPIKIMGERVEKFVVDAYVDGAWQQVAEGTNIGYKRILRFPDVTTDKIRVRVLESRLEPLIANVSAHHYQSRPPQLAATHALDGNVAIAPRQQGFGWKDHGENAAENLNAGYVIYYTVDGSEPDTASTVYSGPFVLDKGELKAVAMINGESGPMLKEQIGYIKAGMDVASTSAEEQHAAEAACDADPRTFWLSKEEARPSITIDMKDVKPVSGFSYTPPTGFDGGMMAKGNVMVSADGKKWTDAGTFEFGNLINDPSVRYHFLPGVVDARYVKLVVTEKAAGAKRAAAAEIDIF